MIYGAEGASILNADIIYNVGADTYVCKLDPTKVDRSTDAAPVEQQPVWSICKYENLVIDEQTTRLNTKYPYGNTAYAFIATEYNTYNYKFRL